MALVSGGLWEKKVGLREYGAIDFNEIMRLAEEQSVVGLVTAGLERVKDVRVPQEMLLQFIGQTLQIEQHNQAMNEFIAQLIEKLRKEDIYAILVKGQGVAQCYEKPLWRASGDVDLLLSEDNYKAAKKVLAPIADEVADENKATMHQAFVIKGFEVELHGKMPFTLSKRADRVVCEVQRNVIYGGDVRSWQNGKNIVLLPSPDNDIIFVFTHFLLHFFIEGVGLRQICDWCRLLYTYKDSLNQRLLESRIRKAGLMSEWKAFANLAVNTLGMPEEAMPFYDSRLKVKGEMVLKRILKSGNFGHNNDLSYRSNYTGIRYKIVAAWRRFVEFSSLVPVFPLDMPRFYVTYLLGKVRQ